MTRPWVIWVDCVITKRKRFHCVFDPADEEKFRSRVLWDCIEWLEAEEVEVYWLLASDPRHPGLVPGVIARKEIPSWPS